MSDFDRERACAFLREPLDKSKVKPAPQGKFGEYVDGFHVITEANRIFGEFGWAYNIKALELVCRHEAKDSKGNPQIRVGYMCRVVAAVDGITREGAAVGSGMSKPNNEEDAHESAVKEAETGALKRALRSFGYTFGLALYDKSQEHVGTPYDPEPRKAWLLKQIERAPNNDGLHAIRNHARFIEFCQKAPELTARIVTEALEAKEQSFGVPGGFDDASVMGTGG